MRQVLASPAPTRAPEAAVHPVFAERWSPRSFRDEPVPPEELRSLFEAARWAPSSNNEQPWLFLYATSPRDRERFSSALLEGNRVWATRAPVLAFLLAFKRSRYTDRPNPMAVFDAGAAWMSLALQARLLGLDAHAMGGIDRSKAHEVLGVPRDEYDVVIGVAIGRRGDPSALPPALAERERPSPRRPLAEVAMEGSLGDSRAGPTLSE